MREAVVCRRTGLRSPGELHCHGNIATGAALVGAIRHRIERVVRERTTLSTRAASDADRVRGKYLRMRAIWRRTIRFNVRHLVACRELSGGAIPIRGQRQHRYTPVQPRRRHTADDTSRQWFADAATDRAAQSVQHRRQLHHQTAMSRTIAVDKSCPVCGIFNLHTDVYIHAQTLCFIVFIIYVLIKMRCFFSNFVYIYNSGVSFLILYIFITMCINNN